MAGGATSKRRSAAAARASRVAAAGKELEFKDLVREAMMDSRKNLKKFKLEVCSYYIAQGMIPR